MKHYKTYYIQSKPPTHGFVHHACFAALKKIVLTHGTLKEGRPYRGISLTTDPGRFLSHVPGFAASVDGFIEFEDQVLLDQGLVFPCLYRATAHEAKWARKNGYEVFENPPQEYKYLLRFAVKNVIFLRENEWLHLGDHLNLPFDYKVYLNRKLMGRFATATNKIIGWKNATLHSLDEYPRRENEVREGKTRLSR